MNGHTMNPSQSDAELKALRDEMQKFYDAHFFDFVITSRKVVGIVLLSPFAGYYETVVSGTRYLFERVTTRDGFSRTEWHWGDVTDPHADQCDTLKDCVSGLLSLIAFTQDRAENPHLYDDMPRQPDPIEVTGPDVQAMAAHIANVLTDKQAYPAHWPQDDGEFVYYRCEWPDGLITWERTAAASPGYNAKQTRVSYAEYCLNTYGYRLEHIS